MKKLAYCPNPYFYLLIPTFVGLIAFGISLFFIDPWFISISSFIASLWLMLTFFPYRRYPVISVSDDEVSYPDTSDPANSYYITNLYNPANPNSIYTIGKAFDE